MSNIVNLLSDIKSSDKAVFLLVSQSDSSYAFEKGYSQNFLDFVSVNLNSYAPAGFVEVITESEDVQLTDEDKLEISNLVGDRKLILVGKSTVQAVAPELISGKTRYLSLLEMGFLTCSIGKAAIIGHPLSYQEVYKGNIEAQQKLITRIEDLIVGVHKEYEVEIIDASIDQLDDILSLCSSQPAIGYDIEANDLDIWAVHWEKNLFSLSVFESPTKIMSFWLNWRDFKEADKEKFKLFLKENQKKIWTYNCTYEIQAAWRIFGERFLFQDAMVLTTMDSNRADLKTNARKYLKCDFWEDELASIRDSYERFFKLFLDAGKKGSLQEKFSDFVKSDNFKSLSDLDNFLLENKRDPEKLMKEMRDLAVSLGDDEVVKGISEFPYQWSAVPFDILGKYCCYDSAYTLPLAAILYEKYEKGYHHYIKHPWLVCIFEAWGAGWNESKAKSVEDEYVALMIESLSELQSNLKPTLGMGAVEAIDIKNWKLPKTIHWSTPTGQPREHVVDTELKRYIELKGIWNPNSNTADSRSKFWKVYLTERVELATFAYALINDLRFRGIWDKLLIIMMNMTEFKATKENSENEFLSTYGAATVLEMISTFLENPSLTDRETVRILTSSFSETDRTYKDFTGKNAKEVMQAQYEIQTMFFGIDVDDESTWTPEFKLIFLLQKFKKIDKALSTYVNGKLGRGCVWLSKMRGELPPIRLKRFWDIPEGYQLKEDERLIAFYDFNSLSAATHRWSSGFHTISPGVAVRAALEPHNEDEIWTHIDFSQAELVMLAFFSQDPNMIEVFKSGGDMHRYVASLVYNKKPEDVTSEERRVAKTVSFGIVYGKGIENLALEITGGDVPKAQAIFDAFFVAFPGIKVWMDERKAQGRSTGKVENLFGALIEVEDGFSKGNAIDRHSVNYPIQSSSSMVAGGSMYDLCSTVGDKGIKGVGIGFVHDALDHTVNIDHLINYITYSREIMQDQVYAELGTPMRIDQEIGANALELCEIDSWERVDDNINIVLSGTSDAVSKIIDKFQNQSKIYDVTSVEQLKAKDDYTSWKGLFTEKGAYSSARGKKFTKIETKITLALN